jgi:hypothetical protein
MIAMKVTGCKGSQWLLWKSLVVMENQWLLWKANEMTGLYIYKVNFCYGNHCLCKEVNDFYGSH